MSFAAVAGTGSQVEFLSSRRAHLPPAVFLGGGSLRSWRASSGLLNRPSPWPADPGLEQEDWALQSRGGQPS